MMQEIDKLPTEKLRINLLQGLKKCNKLESNLDAVKSEMAAKINLLRRELEATKARQANNVMVTDESMARPDSTLSRMTLAKDNE